MAIGATQLVVQEALEMTWWLGRVVLVLVDAHHDGDVLALGRGRDEDLLRAGGEVLGRVLALGEDAGGLDDDVGAQLAPGQVGGVALGHRLERHVTDGDRVVGVADVLLQATEDAVVLQQVHQGGIVGQVVDADDLDVRTLLQQRAEVVATDTAKAVDAYADRHEPISSLVCRSVRRRLYGMSPTTTDPTSNRRCA
ncbi:hypothetical protein GCM10020221_34790 [Streptomyces thioluteus]|uniref:Uncharacterized protein n=1 Tax=Streptomyces thioluteus TaxID=66431 RepID=A0ABP6JMJ2_STRTU